MKKTLKKSLSVLLALVLLSVSTLPVAFAEKEENPIIYVCGMGSVLKDANGKTIEAADVDKDYIINATKDVVSKIPVDPNGNWDEYCDALYDCFAPIYDEIRLDKNGEASDGSHVARTWSKNSIKKKYSNYTAEDYYYAYDWRIDPFEVAKDLGKYIDAVREVTGKSKVTIIGRCLGACIVTAYLVQEENVWEKVQNVIYYAPSVGGIGLLGALFSGRIELDDESIDRYINAYSEKTSLIEDSSLQALVVSVISFARYLKLLGFGTDVIMGIYNKVYENIVPRLALTSYGSFPSFWSMIGTEYYEEARDFVFKGQEEEYSKMIEKTDHFYYDVTAKLPEIIKELNGRGTNFAYIAKYNSDIVPVFKGSNVQGDGIVELTTLSGGATSAKMGSCLPEEYIKAAKENGTEKYISADKLVDASTCLFPDTTWFIKNIDHVIMPDCINPLLVNISKGNGSFTVWSSEEFPQYMTYSESDGSVKPVVRENDNLEHTPKDFISSIFRLFTNFFKFLKSLFDKRK